MDNLTRDDLLQICKEQSEIILEMKTVTPPRELIDDAKEMLEMMEDYFDSENIGHPTDHDKTIGDIKYVKKRNERLKKKMQKIEDSGKRKAINLSWTFSNLTRVIINKITSMLMETSKKLGYKELNRGHSIFNYLVYDPANKYVYKECDDKYLLLDIGVLFDGYTYNCFAYFKAVQKDEKNTKKLHLESETIGEDYTAINENSSIFDGILI